MDAKWTWFGSSKPLNTNEPRRGNHYSNQGKTRSFPCSISCSFRWGWKKWVACPSSLVFKWHKILMLDFAKTVFFNDISEGRLYSLYFSTYFSSEHAIKIHEGFLIASRWNVDVTSLKSRRISFLNSLKIWGTSGEIFQLFLPSNSKAENKCTYLCTWGGSCPYPWRRIGTACYAS